MISLPSEALSAMNAPNSTPDQRGNADGVEAMAGPQMKAHKVAQGVGERKDLVVMPPLERPMAWL